jgi:hypothetical protein
MEYVTHNTDTIDSSGTSLQGEVVATYEELTSLFGAPHESDGYKVDAEWVVRFSDGLIATIYNWKNGVNYCGVNGTPVEQIKSWHVGGQHKQASDRVQIALDLLREERTADSVPPGRVVSVANDMLDSVEAQHGTAFAKAVYLALLSLKQNEIVRVALLIRDPDSLPDEIIERIAETMAGLSATSLNLMTDCLGIKGRASGEAVMEWATRIFEAEAKQAADITHAILNGKAGA